MHLRSSCLFGGVVLSACALGCGPAYRGVLFSPNHMGEAVISSHGGTALDMQSVTITVRVNEKLPNQIIFSGHGAFYGDLSKSDPTIRWINDKRLLVEYSPEENKNSCRPATGELSVLCEVRGK